MSESRIRRNQESVLPFIGRKGIDLNQPVCKIAEANKMND